MHGAGGREITLEFVNLAPSPAWLVLGYKSFLQTSILPSIKWGYELASPGLWEGTRALSSREVPGGRHLVLGAWPALPRSEF